MAELSAGLTGPPPSVYLDGNAWGCGFYGGAQEVFEETWGLDFASKMVVQGDSAGALVALIWAVGLPSAFFQSVYSELASAPAEMLKLRLSDYHDAAMDRIFEAFPDAHLRVRGRLQVGVTVFPRRHVWVSEFNDLAHLRNVLHCSMHIPIYCREVPFLDGVPVVDGAISMGGRHLADGERTVVISASTWANLPSCNFSDISHFLGPSQCLLPPWSQAGVEALFELGRTTTRAWLKQAGTPQAGGPGERKRRGP
eukprot:CAMPEP_0115132398 /NCGR_PEP_ID=MMETSP0227-20121206/53716_1 /TAXON_ID=89957 /ORGANISM="Polarella glacialis, Strain CCMP 1383" /LENGTH=253 /DNA_ID=CAMNT_0002538157 /DNA_START=48 /DNA_END=806 /DNA_ORIENTATION=+